MLKRLKQRNLADFNHGEDIDAIAYLSDGINSAAAVNIVRGGRLMGVKTFSINDASMSAGESLTTFAVQYYSANQAPAQICFNADFDFEPLRDFLKVLGIDAEITVPQKGAKKKLLSMAEHNAEDYLKNFADSIKREEDMTKGATERLASILGIKSATTIECYDISNISGTDTVASQVTFTNGVPYKNRYRHYKIKTVEGADDYESIREAIYRRFSYAQKKDFPDLVVIDGGKGQLKAAEEAMFYSGANVPMISLAKKQELIFIEGKSEPLNLSRSDYALRLLMRIRDEAHRFAISYHRTLRKSRLKSELSKIKGVGNAKLSKLLKNLTFKEASTLSAKEIAQRAGIDQRTAENIQNYFLNKAKSG